MTVQAFLFINLDALRLLGRWLKLREEKMNIIYLEGLKAIFYFLRRSNSSNVQVLIAS